MLVVVGGHSRNIGKTSMVVGLIRKTRDLKWTAVKISQYGHGVCAQDGKPCGCEAETGEDVAHGMWGLKPQFLVQPPRYVTAAISDFVRSKLSAASAR